MFMDDNLIRPQTATPPDQPVTPQPQNNYRQFGSTPIVAQPSIPTQQTMVPMPPVDSPPPALATPPAEAPPKSSRKKIALVALAVLVIAVVAYILFTRVYHTNNGSSADSTPVAKCSIATQTTDNQSFQLPSGWNWYEIKSIGLKYAYPISWGDQTTQTNSGSIQEYVSSFTVKPSGATTLVSLSPDCSDFVSNLSDINNGKFDVLSGPTITKAIDHSQLSYSSLSHWSNDAGNQYKLTISRVVSIEGIRSVIVDYSVVTGSQLCPDDKLASNDQTECITQSTADEVNKIISSLQKI